MTNGKFVISLDFELMWGVRDKKDKTNYGDNILGVHKVIPKLLETFRKFDIKATFSTVGLLFFETKQELLKSIPSIKPQYKDLNLSAYNGHFDIVGGGSKLQELIAKAKDSNLKNIHFHGFCDPKPFLTKAKIFCMTSEK